MSDAAPIVLAEGLSKRFRVAEKPPGLGGTLRHLLRRRYRDVAAVQEVSFAIEPGEVVGFLADHGVARSRLTARGYGAELPRDDNGSADGRDHNRRVEFVIVPCPEPTP